eukprot:scaffold5305_cov30-Cyclotella_meneghiniana.AAC.3
MNYLSWHMHLCLQAIIFTAAIETWMYTQVISRDNGIFAKPIPITEKEMDVISKRTRMNVNINVKMKINPLEVVKD